MTILLKYDVDLKILHANSVVLGNELTQGDNIL